MTVNLLVKDRAGVRHGGRNRFSAMTTVVANHSAEVWQRTNLAAEWLPYISPVESFYEQTLRHWLFITPPADHDGDHLEGETVLRVQQKLSMKWKGHTRTCAQNAWPYTHLVALYLQKKKKKQRPCVYAYVRACVIRGSLLVRASCGKTDSCNRWAMSLYSSLSNSFTCNTN